MRVEIRTDGEWRAVPDTQMEDAVFARTGEGASLTIRGGRVQHAWRVYDDDGRLIASTPAEPGFE